MRAFIYTGGKINKQNITEHPKGDDIKIAADSGYENAIALGEKPDILLGDFDSISVRPDKDIETVEVPSEKDFTDTQLAIETAVRKGADDIVIIGGLSGRLDHTLSNLSALEDLWSKRIHAVATDGFNRVRYIDSSSALITRSHYKYLSVIAVSDVLKGVDIEGCKYPLKNAKISRSFQFAVSNEITGNCALIAIRKGKAFIVESAE
jgi:thiamine pyrophosphokinase